MYDSIFGEAMISNAIKASKEIKRLKAENAELKKKGLSNIYKIKNLLFGFNVPKIQNILHEWGMELAESFKKQKDETQKEK